MAAPDRQGRGRALLSRRRIADIVVALAVAGIAIVALALACEVVCGLRWRTSEGGTRWALLRRQFHFHDWSDLTPELFWLAPNHVWRRLLYPPMSGEALLRLAIAGVAVIAIGGGLVVVAYVTRTPKHRGDARWGTVAGFIISERPDDTWSGAGRMLFAALIGYVMASENCRGQRHRRSVARMTVTGKDISTVLKSLVAAEASKLPAWVCDAFNQYIALEPEARNSAVFNINMAMNPWNNPLISAVTATSDFDIRRLRQDRMAIFLVCSIAELVQFRPIIRILFQHIHDLMMMERPKPKDRHEVLIALDEFRHLGPMPQLLSMLTISAGYKFRMAIMIQSVRMLDELYGKAVRLTTLAGSQVNLFIAIDDLDTANYISEMPATGRSPSSPPAHGLAPVSPRRVSIRPISKRSH